MINRTLLKDLLEWKDRTRHKPLVLRGARQVGKTTIVDEFSKNYDVYLRLNLEKEKDRMLFEEDDMDKLVTSIFYHCKKLKTKKSVLLFIDEIQNSKKAVASLRYFYEELNYIDVISAGSLLETLMDVRDISFPVGRVEFMYLRPCSFYEFLDGMGEHFDLEIINRLDVEGNVIHERLISLFNDYVLVGGMPELIKEYSVNRDINAVNIFYESILNAYKDDVEKYTKNSHLIEVVRAILTYGWNYAAETITFEKFGGTAYSSRDMSAAFQIINKAMMLELVYPTSSVRLPIISNLRKKPKLLWLDTGLVNYISGIQYDVFSASNIQDIWRGRIAEHIVGQEILCLDNRVSANRSFWRRDVKTSEAEVDFILPYKGLLIPIEVKSGHRSRLKSLMSFMEEAPHNLAVRVWGEPFSVEEITLPSGKIIKLINLPFYYVGKIKEVLDNI